MQLEKEYEEKMQQATEQALAEQSQDMLKIHRNELKALKKALSTQYAKQEQESLQAQKAVILQNVKKQLSLSQDNLREQLNNQYIIELKKIKKDAKDEIDKLKEQLEKTLKENNIVNYSMPVMDQKIEQLTDTLLEKYQRKSS